MPWLVDKRTPLQKLGTNILKVGLIPKHVGFIMDGNRRYGKAKSLSLFDTYMLGHDKMEEVATWCMKFGITEITFYSFSIENFKRPEDEKEIIFFILQRELESMLNEPGKIEQCAIDGICFRFVGDWTLVPENIRGLMASIMLKTRGNGPLIWNVAFAYTARNEITRASETLRQAMKTRTIEPEDISEEFLFKTLQTLPSSPVDLIIRTSAVNRLSDFLLWQCSNAILTFVEPSWPEIAFWNFWKCILEYQSNIRKANQRCAGKIEFSVDSEAKERQNKLTASLVKETWEKLTLESESILIKK